MKVSTIVSNNIGLKTTNHGKWFTSIRMYSTSILIFDSLQDRIEYRIENTEKNRIE